MDANYLRRECLKIITDANACHIGSCFSIAEILAVLYGGVLRENDVFILSKGHAAAILYVCLAERGCFPKERLSTFYREGSDLEGCVSHKVPGVVCSTGSLGHGLPIACGMALADRNRQVYVLLGDGELQEGSNWEAMMFASHHNLCNLTAIVDKNRIQACGEVASVLCIDPLDKKAQAFGWSVVGIDGHDENELRFELQHTRLPSLQPRMIIAHTTKGKGVPFMENQLCWHYKQPSEEELALALEELS